MTTDSIAEEKNQQLDTKMADHLLEDFDKGVLTLTMNRPEARNAMSPDMMSKLGGSVPRAASDPSVRCLVLTGAGGAFCAGGDVKGFARAVRAWFDRRGCLDAALAQRLKSAWSLRKAMDLGRTLFEMPKPTLAIPGAAAGRLSCVGLRSEIRTGYGKIDYSIFKDWDPVIMVEATFYRCLWAMRRLANSISRQISSPVRKPTNWGW